MRCPFSARRHPTASRRLQAATPASEIKCTCSAIQTRHRIYRNARGHADDQIHLALQIAQQLSRRERHFTNASHHHTYLLYDVAATQFQVPTSMSSSTRRGGLAAICLRAEWLAHCCSCMSHGPHQSGEHRASSTALDTAHFLEENRHTSYHSRTPAQMLHSTMV